MSRRPRLSVVIPAFQSETRIGSTLRRLRAQTLCDYEVVVVNDGSTDRTAEVVRACMAHDPRIRLVEQPNRGVAAARNRGVAAASGEVLAFLDDDDLWLPPKLELQLAALDARPDAAAVSCFSGLVDDEGRLLGWRFGGETNGDVYRQLLEWDLVSGGSVALVRRGPLESVGGFDEAFSYRADWDLWIRLARHHPFAFVPKVLVGYTRRDGTLSRRYDAMLAEGRAVLAKAQREDPGIGPRALRAYASRDLFGAMCLGLMDGELAVARRFLVRALRSAPWMILREPRRWGVVLMLALASAAPGDAYRRALAVMSRTAFRLEVGESFDALHPGELASG